MRPGEHVIVVGTGAAAMRARGLVLRDTVLLLLPGVRVTCAYLFRAPLDSTVAENTLKHGCGGLWIDGCRVGTSKQVPRGLSRTAGTSLCGSKDGSLRHETGQEGGYNPNIGRWPTNLVLVHGPGCVQQGTRRVRGSHDAMGVWGKGGSDACYEGGWVRDPKELRPGFTAPDGTETVAAWVCQGDCPVRVLDEQSGFLHGAGNKRTTQTSPFSNLGGTGLRGQEVNPNYHENHGGTSSRFFPQFASLGEALAWLHRLAGGPDGVPIPA